MSIWPDRPNDFVNWASRRCGPRSPGEFLPRELYGQYVRESLLETVREAGESTRLTIMFDEVRRMTRHPCGGWMVHFNRSPSLPAATVVLAIGHRPPPDPLGRAWSGPRSRFVADPWAPLATNAISPDESIVILGSGLTAVDAALLLSQEQRRAPITIISRRGLIPHSHSSAPLRRSTCNPWWPKCWLRAKECV